MGRLLRFVIGVCLALVATALTLRYGQPTYLALPGAPVQVTVLGPCVTDRFLSTEQATRCEARWLENQATRRSAVVAADPLAVGGTVSAKAFADRAYVAPTGTGLILGYASVPLLLLGLYLALKPRRRRRRAGDGRRPSGHRRRGHGGGSDSDDDDDYEYANDSGSSDSSGGGDSGGGGGGDGGGGGGGGD